MSEEENTNQAKEAALIASIADLYGFSFDSVVAELSSTSALAAFVRDLFDLQVVESVQRKRGRPTKLEENWKLFVWIEVARRSGSTLSKAIDDLVQMTEGDNETGSRVDAIRRQYTRMRAKWSADDVPNGVAALFSPPPE